MPSLEGKVALVTGAGRGIGRAVAASLAGAGAALGITARTESDLSETVAQVRGRGTPTVAVPGDASVPADVDNVILAVERQLGPIHLLVNNAGIAGSVERRLWEEDRDEWWRIVEVNLRGPMLFAHAVLPGMVSRGRGYIVNINSLAGARALPGFSAYSVSKAALFRMTDILAASLEKTGVCVFDLSPGLVRTAMTRALPIWASAAEDAWTPAEKTGELILKLTSGRFDELRGRFIRATEDVDALLDQIRSAATRDARKLRLVPTGPDDPVMRYV